MSVVRRGTAVVAVVGAVLLGPVGAAGAQEELPPDDPSISEQAVDTPTADTPTADTPTADTPTAGIDDDVETTGCGPDPTICESSAGAGGGTGAGAGGGTGGGAGAGAVLPRTGPYDRLLATGAVGVGLLVAGAGAVAAGRRRTA